MTAVGQPHSRFEDAHHFSDRKLLGRSRQRNTAVATALAGDETSATEFLRYLGDMIVRKPLLGGKGG